MEVLSLQQRLNLEKIFKVTPGMHVFVTDADVLLVVGVGKNAALVAAKERGPKWEFLGIVESSWLVFYKKSTSWSSIWRMSLDPPYEIDRVNLDWSMPPSGITRNSVFCVCAREFKEYVLSANEFYGGVLADPISRQLLSTWENFSRTQVMIYDGKAYELFGEDKLVQRREVEIVDFGGPLGGPLGATAGARYSKISHAFVENPAAGPTRALCLRYEAESYDAKTGLVKHQAFWAEWFQLRCLTWTTLREPRPAKGRRNRAARRDAGKEKEAYRQIAERGAKIGLRRPERVAGLFASAPDPNLAKQFADLKPRVLSASAPPADEPTGYNVRPAALEILARWSAFAVEQALRHAYYAPPSGPGYVAAVDA